MDIRSSSETGGLPVVEATAAVENRKLTELEDKLTVELKRLCSYTMKSARHRVKLVKTREIAAIQMAVASEIAVSAGSYRLDLADNLLHRLERITKLVAAIEEETQKDYETRFGKPMG